MWKIDNNVVVAAPTSKTYTFISYFFKVLFMTLKIIMLNVKISDTKKGLENRKSGRANVYVCIHASGLVAVPRRECVCVFKVCLIYYSDGKKAFI